MKKKINLGLIGLGSWGKNYFRIFSDLKKSNIKLICDKKIKNIYGSIFTKYSSDLINSKEIDAVVISTEAKSHFKLAHDALMKGKHVLVEKPLTTNHFSSEKLTKLAKSKKKVLMVGHTFLYNEAIKKIKKIIKSNSIGKIYYINCRRTHIGPIRKDVNVIWDLASHDISIINYLLDDSPNKTFSVGAKHISKNLDVSYINLFYKNKIIGNIHVSWEDSNKSRIVEIIGSKARIVFDDLNLLEPIKIYNKGIGIKHDNSNFGESHFKLRDGNITSPKVQLKEPLREMSIEFLNCIINQKKPISDGVFSTKIVKILERINKKLNLAQ